MIEVLLLTGFYKTENLPKLYDSIKSEFDMARFHITWFLCKDSFHTSIDPAGFIKKVSDENIVSVYLFEVGADKKNYGGALFNKPLKWAMENGFKEIDPWVYILDHDNVIHPLLPFFIGECEEKHKDKVAMWLNFMITTGNVYLPDRYTGFSNVFVPEIGLIVNKNVTDPSSLVLKFSVYLDIYPLSEEYNYDSLSFRGMLFKLWNEGKLIMQNDMEYWRDRAGTYHNAIIEKDVFDKYHDNEENLGICVMVQDNRPSTENDGRIRFILPKEANHEIMNIVQKYVYEKSSRNLLRRVK